MKKQETVTSRIIITHHEDGSKSCNIPWIKNPTELTVANYYKYIIKLSCELKQLKGA